MGRASPPAKGAGIRNLLEVEDFYALTRQLVAWRTDPTVAQLHKDHGKGLALAFVRGLRLAARLVYVLRKSLSSAGVEVDWGHVVTPEGLCSRECDIIVHRPGHKERWNGHEKPVMDFAFIEHADVVAVISCKSQVRSIDSEYCKDMRPHVKDILLFGECCNPAGVERLRKRAADAGYKGFWYLYTYDPTTEECVEDPEVWGAFLERCKSLCAEAVPRA